MRIMRAGVVALLFLAFPLCAQVSRNTAYFEIGGNGVIPTVNYERRFTERLNGRIGLSYASATDEGSDDVDAIFVFPMMVNYLSNPGHNHHFELGAGITFVTGETSAWATSLDEDFSDAFGTATIGYRYQKPGRGFVFRAGLTPLFDSSGIVPWGGFSLGYGW